MTQDQCPRCGATDNIDAEVAAGPGDINARCEWDTGLLIAAGTPIERCESCAACWTVT